jgi:chromate transporter
MSGEQPRVGFGALYRVFFWIGLFSFGGGLLPWIQREIVTLRGWMKDEEFLPGVALAQILPGVNSTNLAVFVGQRLRGAPGSVVAVIGMLTGPFLVMLVAAVTYQYVLGAPAIQAAMAGAAAGAIGMMLNMGVAAVRSASRGVATILVMIAVFVAVGVMRWSLIPVVLVAIPVSVALAWPRGARDAG